MSKKQNTEPLKLSTSSPPRPQHQIKRSITELSAPVKLPRPHNHLRHHHLHPRKHLDRDERPALSAGAMSDLSRGSLDLPRSEGVTPATIAADSPYNSAMSPLATGNAANNVGNGLRSPVVSKEERIRKQQEVAIARTEDLKASLGDLNDFQTATMRHLDDTYYAILEKLSKLQNTVVSLKELAAMAQELNEAFKTESQGLVDEIEAQLQSFGQLDDQQQRIQDLQGRIHVGRKKVEALSKRVDVVRERIEGWERADREWQERTRKRIRIIWMVMLVLLFVPALVFFGAQYAGSAFDVTAITELASENTHGGSRVDEAAKNQSRSAADITDELRQALSQRKTVTHADDEVFRAFDEL
ncbi:hypothetical protein F4778DRAFT_776531 [Xylariomycetidae sp. FL2044]|nr:hypothetical protein F4778DRAFT_776531 [Xylariomycetidae sp. FL2044]